MEIDFDFIVSNVETSFNTIQSWERDRDITRAIPMYQYVSD